MSRSTILPVSDSVAWSSTTCACGSSSACTSTRGRRGRRFPSRFTCSWRSHSSPAGRVSDDLADYVSYADIVEQLKARAASTRHVNLVETLAEEVAALALADKRVASVVVDVRKTEIIPEAEGVGVIIRRHCGPLRVKGRTDDG